MAPTPGYSHIVKVTGGQTIYLADQVALDASRNLVGRGDFRAQAQQVFENIKSALAAVGADFSHVVKLNMYVVDRSKLPLLREVRDLYMNTQAPPASPYFLSYLDWEIINDTRKRRIEDKGEYTHKKTGASVGKFLFL